VRVNGDRAKPATTVKIGDEVRVRGEGGAGRPTKRERREIDRLRGRD
jgi:ribosomal 50S subunit-recycling heat shock protein